MQFGERVLGETSFFDTVETTKTFNIVSKTDGSKVFYHNYNNQTILYQANFYNVTNWIKNICK